MAMDIGRIHLLGVNPTTDNLYLASDFGIGDPHTIVDILGTDYGVQQALHNGAPSIINNANNANNAATYNPATNIMDILDASSDEILLHHATPTRAK